MDEPPPAGRRIPGPAPPKSWIKAPSKRPLLRTSIPDGARSRLEPRARFLDLEFPRAQSLIHHSLLALGTYFYEHQEFNKYYLPTLNIQLKQQLLSFIAAKNLTGPITKVGLDVLFPYFLKKEDPAEMVDIIRSSKHDESYVQYLDLTDAVGRTLKLQQLRSFLYPTHPSPLSDWDIQEPRFPNLTHLSLDVSPLHPPNIDPFKLAHVLSEFCTRLTHLSVAGIFHSSSVTSASALIYLSKHLVRLEYIDMSRTPILQLDYGCVDSLWENDPQGVKGDGANWTVFDRLDWAGSWRLVRTVVARNCGRLTEAAARKGILQRRGGKGWVHVIAE